MLFNIHYSNRFGNTLLGKTKILYDTLNELI